MTHLPGLPRLLTGRSRNSENAQTLTEVPRAPPPLSERNRLSPAHRRLGWTAKGRSEADRRQRPAAAFLLWNRMPPEFLAACDWWIWPTHPASYALRSRLGCIETGLRHQTPANQRNQPARQGRSPRLSRRRN